MPYYESNHSGADFLRRKISIAKNLNCALHFHTSFEFLSVKSGKVTLGVEGEKYELSAGDEALILPNIAHEYITADSSEIGIVIFNSDYLAELYDESKEGIVRYPVLRSEKGLFRELETVEEDHLLFRSVLYKVAAAYRRNGTVVRAPRRNGDFTRALTEYLDLHYAEPISESSVARMLGYHKRYLSVMIAKNFGVSFPRLLNERRIKVSKLQLKEGKASITEIYLSVGYNSQTSFNRNFKAIMGISPMEYRRRLRADQREHGGEG